MTTNYPSGPTPTGPVGPGDLPPGRTPAWGCAWWWWLCIFIIILLIIWWAGWGWGPHGGYWFRARPAGTPSRTAPATGPIGSLTIPQSAGRAPLAAIPSPQLF